MKPIAFSIYEEKTPVSMLSMHSHEHWEIYFLAKGQRNYYIGNSFYVLQKGAMAIIPPYTLHRTEGGSFLRYAVKLYPSSLTPYQKELLNDLSTNCPVFQIPEESQPYILNDFLDGLSIYLEKPHMYEVLNAIVTHILWCLEKNINLLSLPKETASTTQHSSLAVKALAYLQKNYAQKITLDMLSQQFHCTKATLINNFHKAVNTSVMDYLTDLRINKAKELLTSTNKSISAIAELCGFSSANYFTLIFTKKEKLSPLNYRKFAI